MKISAEIMGITNNTTDEVVSTLRSYYEHKGLKLKELETDEGNVVQGVASWFHIYEVDIPILNYNDRWTIVAYPSDIDDAKLRLVHDKELAKYLSDKLQERVLEYLMTSTECVVMTRGYRKGELKDVYVNTREDELARIGAFKYSLDIKGAGFNTDTEIVNSYHYGANFFPEGYNFDILPRKTFNIEGPLEKIKKHIVDLYYEGANFFFPDRKHDFSSLLK